MSTGWSLELGGRGFRHPQARAAARTKGSYYSAQYSPVARRRGPNKAAVAVAHSMLECVWHLLTTGALYKDPGADYFERRHDPAVEAKRLRHRIEALGFSVTSTFRFRRATDPACQRQLHRCRYRPPRAHAPLGDGHFTRVGGVSSGWHGCGRTGLQRGQTRR
jgi:hypothetical protein